MRSIILKIWLTVMLTNLVVFGLLGIFLGKLVHDFHFDFKAHDLRLLGEEINTTLESSGKKAALSYAQAMARHSSAKIAVHDSNDTLIFSTDDKFFSKIPSQKLTLTYKRNHYHVKAFNDELILVLVPGASKKYSTAIYTPVGPIAETINMLWLYIFYTLLGVTVIMTILSYFISKQVSLPLVKLNKEALKIAEGEFDNLSVPDTKDEIGQLGNSILYVAQNMKSTLQERERLYQIQKDFLANVSHDLRTPLSLIKGYAIAIKQKVVEGQEKEEALNIILDESERMQNLTDELLNFAKMDAGKEKIKLTTIDIYQLTQQVITPYLPALNAHAIKVELVNHLHNNEIFGDKDKLLQVILNLFSNAIKNTPIHGKITITLARANDSLIYKINNTGSFISPENIQYIWERFYKVEKSRSASQGTGLGLAIVRGIILAHGGEVSVESSEKEGTTFCFSLPAIKMPLL